MLCLYFLLAADCKETFRRIAPPAKMKKGFKIAAIALVIIAGIFIISWQLDFSRGAPAWGITFSQKYAEEDLKLDWRKAYLSMLDDLNVKKLRLVAYWSKLEPEKGKLNFQDLDWQVREAEKRDREIILVLGYRVPRWPECFIPSWTDPAKKGEFEKSLDEYLKATVEHYKTSSAIKVWQVENEPLLSVFGECPEPDRELLKREIALVKSIDSSRPILITDSGELSLWVKTAGLSEILGTTMYRSVWNRYVGQFWYFYPPAFYALKAFLAVAFSGTERVIIAELQAEPWSPAMKPIADVPLDEQTKIFSVNQLKTNLRFAEKSGLLEAYLWGAEWWYWRKMHGDDSYWESMKSALR